jgi:hypothetical protein
LCIKSNDKFTQSNGLIGQAWVVETLIEAYDKLGNKLYLKIAEDLIEKHEFDFKHKLWKVLSVDGEILRIHTTLNQQIWFSTMAYILSIKIKNDKIKSRAHLFFKSARSIFKMKDMNHFAMVIRNSYRHSNIKSFILHRLKNLQRSKMIVDGYVSFSTHALAILYKFNSDLEIWDEIIPLIIKSITYCDEIVFNLGKRNPFVFGYHPTGFEMAFIKQTFEKKNISSIVLKGKWFEKQLDNHYDYDKNLMNRNTMDPNTLMARFYEVCRLR